MGGGGCEWVLVCPKKGYTVPEGFFSLPFFSFIREVSLSCRVLVRRWTFVFGVSCALLLV